MLRLPSRLLRNQRGRGSGRSNRRRREHREHRKRRQLPACPSRPVCLSRRVCRRSSLNPACRRRNRRHRAGELRSRQGRGSGVRRRRHPECRRAPRPLRHASRVPRRRVRRRSRGCQACPPLPVHRAGKVRKRGQRQPDRGNVVVAGRANPLLDGELRLRRRDEGRHRLTSTHSWQACKRNRPLVQHQLRRRLHQHLELPPGLPLHVIPNPHPSRRLLLHLHRRRDHHLPLHNRQCQGHHRYRGLATATSLAAYRRRRTRRARSRTAGLRRLRPEHRHSMGMVALRHGWLRIAEGSARLRSSRIFPTVVSLDR